MSLAAVPSIGRASAPEADLTRALYERHATQIFRYCRHQLRSREEAEDAVQTTFLNALRALRRGAAPELEQAWLFKIAHNVCLSRHRTTWRRGRIEAPVDFELVEELAPAPARGADELIGLQGALEQLPERQRRAILLREWQGLSYREVAEELGLSQAAVETLIFRARRSLAQALEQPVQEKRGRIARALDFGNLLGGLQSALAGGSVAVKVAATVAVVSGTTVVATAPVQPHRSHRPLPLAPPPAAVRPAPAVAPPAAVAPAPKRIVPVRRVTAEPRATRKVVPRAAAALQPVAPAPPVEQAPPPPVEAPAPPAASVPPEQHGHQQDQQQGSPDGQQPTAAEAPPLVPQDEAQHQQHGGNGSDGSRSGDSHGGDGSPQD